MKVSHSWLQTYFEKPIPSAKELAEIFTFHAFEVENVEEKNDDSILDVKVLPDRAHYALSHAGVAEEISVLRKIPIQGRVISSVEENITSKPTARIDSPVFCRRYIGRYIEVPKIAESSKWVSTLLTAIGQRSINSIVDATNYVMFDVGQPLHAFDADAIEGVVHVRAAQEGEKVVLLDGREITLTAQDHVIADDKGALDIAGVKGGKRAEINASTKRILIAYTNLATELLLIREHSSKISDADILSPVPIIITNQTSEGTGERWPRRAGEGAVGASRKSIDTTLPPPYTSTL